MSKNVQQGIESKCNQCKSYTIEVTNSKGDRITKSIIKKDDILNLLPISPNLFSLPDELYNKNPINITHTKEDEYTDVTDSEDISQFLPLPKLHKWWNGDVNQKDFERIDFHL